MPPPILQPDRPWPYLGHESTALDTYCRATKVQDRRSPNAGKLPSAGLPSCRVTSQLRPPQPRLAMDRRRDAMKHQDWQRDSRDERLNADSDDASLSVQAWLHERQRTRTHPLRRLAKVCGLLAVFAFSLYLLTEHSGLGNLLKAKTHGLLNPAASATLRQPLDLDTPTRRPIADPYRIPQHLDPIQTSTLSSAPPPSHNRWPTASNPPTSSTKTSSLAATAPCPATTARPRTAAWSRRNTSPNTRPSKPAAAAHRPGAAPAVRWIRSGLNAGTAAVPTLPNGTPWITASTAAAYAATTAEARSTTANAARRPRCIFASSAEAGKRAGSGIVKS